MRTSAQFQVGEDFRSRLSEFAGRYEEYALLDSCGNTEYGANTFDYLLACAAVAVIVHTEGESVSAELKAAIHEHGDYLFGYLGYELNALQEPVFSSPQQLFQLPAMRFFVPGILVMVKDGTATISIHESTCDTAENVFRTISEISEENLGNFLHNPSPITLKPLVSASDYLSTVDKIRQHIIDGDIYEMNYCQPFVANDVNINPTNLFNRLCSIAKAPFSVLYRFGEQYLICGSPERFFSYNGETMCSMPIKGTRRRGGDAVSDKRLRDELITSEKDRAEHVMIVDLVRNDLTPHAIPGSITVDNLFGIYGFEQVWQMVSTIVARLRPDAHVVDALLHAFPMGSMTGAPKIRAMQLAAQYEPFQRGMYSGTFGYFTPDGHCDFNVVIRSMLYNSEQQILAAFAGGAIVYDSVAEKELEECLLKLSAIRRVLSDLP